MIKSINQLAKACGVPEKTVRASWMKHHAWPFGSGPWKDDVVEKVLAWKTVTLQANRQEQAGSTNGEAASTTTKLKNLKLSKEITILDQTILDKKGRVHDVETCQAEQTERFLKFKTNQRQYVPFDSTRTIDARFRERGWILSSDQLFILQEVIGQKLDETYRAVSGEA